MTRKGLSTTPIVEGQVAQVNNSLGRIHLVGLAKPRHCHFILQAQAMSRTTWLFVAVCLTLTIIPVAAGEPEIGTRSGQMYPDFLLPDLDGKQRRLSEFRGKPVLLFHFASW